MVNINGIPCINSTGVAVSTANVTYSFDNSREIPFAGLVLVRLQQAVPTGTTGTLPVLFGNVPLTGFNGEPVTAANLSGTGIRGLLQQSLEIAPATDGHYAHGHSPDNLTIIKSNNNELFQP